MKRHNALIGSTRVMKPIASLVFVTAFATVVAGPIVRAQSQAPVSPVGGSGRPVTGPVTPTLPNPSTPKPDATGRVRGRVVNALTGAPIARATVLLTSQVLTQGSRPERRSSTTDTEGRWEIADVPRGTYGLTASKSGFATLSFGQRTSRERSRTVNLGAGETSNIDFVLPPAGSIIARILDDTGTPLMGASVRVEGLQYRDGRRQFTPIRGEITNDLGEARLFGLEPGDYLVSADTNVSGTVVATIGTSTSRRTFARTYYPGTPSAAEALRVAVGPGQEQQTIFAMSVAPIARVRGTVRSADGGVPAASTMSVRQSDVPPPFGIFGGILVKPDGSFASDYLFPGDYVLSVSPNNQYDVLPPTVTAAAGPPPPGEYARVPVSVVGADIDSLVITTSKGPTLRGRISFDTGEPPQDVEPQSFSIFARGYATDDLLTPGRYVPHPDWTFEIQGIIGSGILRAARGVPGWFVKSITIDGKDASDHLVDFAAVGPKEIEVVYSRKQTEISGVTVDERGNPTAEYVAVLFTQERIEWRPNSRMVDARTPDQNGRYSFTGLPPGRYYVAAVRFLENLQEEDINFLERLLPTATEFSLDDGETKTVNLKRSVN